MPKPQYGTKHQAERLKWKRVVDAGQASCCLCGEWITPGQPWDLDHLPGTDEYRGAACRRCNRSDGATRGNRARGAQSPTSGRRWVL